VPVSHFRGTDIGSLLRSYAASFDAYAGLCAGRWEGEEITSVDSLSSESSSSDTYLEEAWRRRTFASGSGVDLLGLFLLVFRALSSTCARRLSIPFPQSLLRRDLSRARPSRDHHASRGSARLISQLAACCSRSESVSCEQNDDAAERISDARTAIADPCDSPVCGRTATNLKWWT